MESLRRSLDYMTLQQYPSKSSAKHFEITPVRSPAEHSKYLVTNQGVVDSLRVPQDGTVKIGRQQVTEEGYRPNDIMLSAADRAISRSHCMILYEQFFQTQIPDSWVAFLMGYHPRLGSNSSLAVLPHELLRYILEYLREPKCLYLVDLGSLCGTYVRVSHTEPVDLEENQVFLVGCDIIIEVERVTYDPVPSSLGSETPIEEYGQTVESEYRIDEILPFIHIKVSHNPNDHEQTMQPISHKFIAEEKYKKFTIGRSQMCDIQLAENTISRVQCRLEYHQGKWFIYDGLSEKPSVNGTWLSISKKSQEPRKHSQPFKLKNHSQIKISETILEVSWEE
mmetsp:Transcript_3330/g.5128  ORF Transcript_3330/g.5128 Transcript_3330/m.5128 type:complete len:337 (+) Transcript_3330:1867-2877(+)